jgi:PKD repeat protein
MKNTLLLLLLILLSSLTFGQSFQNKQPLSTQFKLNNKLAVMEMELSPMLPDDEQNNYSTDPLPLRAGYTITLGEKISRQGRWEQLQSGESIWRLSLFAEQAEKLNLYFKNFDLAAGEKLFIYNKDKSVLIGAFTERDNGEYFVSDFLNTNQITIELNTNKQNPKLPFQLDELGVTTINREGDRDFGNSKFCEVPVNCPEGDDWQNEKQGVARVLVKEGNDLWWCSGSLVNNTQQDKTPYFLTANHCGQSANETDYSAWKFYFDYESADCEKPITEPAGITLTGAKLLAKAPNNTSSASDFKLLLLTDEMPEFFHPWYNGWDRSSDVSQNGVCIHHPEGDIKMISTYTEAVVSTRYNSPAPDENGIYWKVNWAETQSNFGVTEGGSSGSPLFNYSGNIIGSLTGGQASCSYPTKPDYYGKFSYSWESNGNNSTRQLKYWLDPDNTGELSLSGSNFNPSDFYADFSVESRNIKLGESIRFTEHAVGNIDKYEWKFPNGEPSAFIGKNPPPIKYATAGNFDVSLRVSNSDNSDLKLKKAYIHVKPMIFPNPTSGKIFFNFGKEGANPESFQIFAYDVTGREINVFMEQTTDKSGIIVDLSAQSRGMYFLRIVAEGKTQIEKIIISK